MVGKQGSRLQLLVFCSIEKKKSHIKAAGNNVTSNWDPYLYIINNILKRKPP